MGAVRERRDSRGPHCLKDPLRGSKLGGSGVMATIGESEILRPVPTHHAGAKRISPLRAWIGGISLSNQRVTGWRISLFPAAFESKGVVLVRSLLAQDALSRCCRALPHRIGGLRAITQE